MIHWIFSLEIPEMAASSAGRRHLTLKKELIIDTLMPKRKSNNLDINDHIHSDATVSGALSEIQDFRQYL